VRRAFEQYATGRHSLKQLAGQLAGDGLTRRGSTRGLNKSSLHVVLHNPVYYGDFAWDGVLYEGTHEPIVSRGLFDQVRRVLDGYNRPVYAKHEFAFRGLLTCGRCGCKITAERQKGRYVYYWCTGHKGKCGQPYVREERIDSMFADLLQGLHIDDEVVEWISEGLRESHQTEQAEHDRAVAALHRGYERLQGWLDKAYQDKLDGVIDEGFWRERSDEWRRQQAAIRGKIEARERANTSCIEQGVRVLELAHKAHSLYQSQDMREKRRLLDFVFSNCTLMDDTLAPEYRTPFGALAEGVKTNNWVPGPDSLRNLRKWMASEECRELAEGAA
jgi:site-specific DNA recombinase